MTVTSTQIRAEYIGTGISVPYAYPFRIFAATDLVVITREAATGLETELSYPGDFTVTGVAERGGGTVTLTQTLPSGDIVSIRRSRPKLQETVLRNQGTFFGEVHEDTFDHVIMVAQDLDDGVRRAVRLADSFDPADYDLTLPTPEPGKALIWNVAGSGLDNGELSDAELSTWSASHNQKLDVFVSGANFTAGVTTALVLSNVPGDIANVEIVRRTGGVPVPVLSDEYTVLADTVTFVAPIPATTTRVEIRYAYTYQLNRVDSANAVFNVAYAGAASRSVRDKLRDVVSVLDFYNPLDPNHTLAFQRAAAAGVKAFVPPGFYTVTGMVTLQAGGGFYGVKGLSIINAVVPDRLFYATGKSDLQLQDLTIQGTMSWGIHINGGSGHFISGNSVTGCTLVYNFGMGGIWTAGITDSTIEDNLCFGNGNAVNESNFDIVVYGVGTPVSDCTVRNNRCRSTGLFVNIAIYNATRCVIEGNEATGAKCMALSGFVLGGYGILAYSSAPIGVYPSQSNVIRNNYVHNVEGIGIYLARQVNTLCVGNTVRETGSVMLDISLPVGAIIIDISPYTTCTDNKVSDSNKHGIQITGDLTHNGSDHSLIANNTVDNTKNTAYQAIGIRGEVLDAKIDNNVITRTYGRAIGPWSDVASRRIIITNNKLRGLIVMAVSQGIVALPASIDWTIYNNEVTDAVDLSTALIDQGVSNRVWGNWIENDRVLSLPKIQARVQLDGDGTLGYPQITLGDSATYGSLGTRYSGGDSYLATNAAQTAPGADSWTQINPAVPSTLLLIDITGKVYRYGAVAGRAPGTFAAFWGAPTCALTASGLEVSGNLVVGVRQPAIASPAANSASLKTATDTIIATMVSHGLIAP